MITLPRAIVTFLFLFCLVTVPAQGQITHCVTGGGPGATLLDAQASAVDQMDAIVAGYAPFVCQVDVVHEIGTPFHDWENGNIIGMRYDIRFEVWLCLDGFEFPWWMIFLGLLG